MTTRRLSDLIGRIYDCALDPRLWPATIETITGSVGAAIGFIVLHDYATQQGRRLFDHGVTDYWRQRYAELVAQNPVTEVVATREVGAVDTLGTMFQDDRWEVSGFNREWMAPQGLRDVLGILVLRNGRRVGWLGALRPAALGPYAPEQVHFFRLLAPHICRALRISDMLDLRSIASEQLAGVLDALATPVFLLDEPGRVTHQNEAASRLLAAARFLRVNNGFLQPLHGAAVAPLDAAIRRALTGEEARVDLPHVIPLGTGEPGQRAVAAVLPLRRTDGDGIVRPYAPAAAVFVQDPETASMPDLAAFGALYNLTAAECRTLAALAGGRGVPEAAATLGISPATVRSHLAAVFEKTGAASQAELVRLIMAAAVPVRGGPTPSVP